MHVATDIYLEARVTVPETLVDLVSDYLIEHASNGLVLEQEEGSDSTTIIFYVLSGAEPFEPGLRRYLSKIMECDLEAVPEIKVRRVENTEWLSKYRESIRMHRIDDDLIVRPPWIEATDDRYQIVVEPRMAFGTGGHATTRSCLRMIRRHFEPGSRFLDMGCGSGILSILADKMGASYIRAVDYDLAAIANCRENFEVNAVATPHDIMTGSIDKCMRDEPYDFVCTNIIRSTILAMFDLLLKLTRSDGYLILSGLLGKDEDAVTQELHKHGQDRFEIVPDEEWLTYAVHKR